ncbi:hypothetical protein PSH79_18560 [Pseudomonas sp. FP2196]|uniref:hypothetical protein n=1 Tax=Pseudomonas sp. FP2196 TaxID=2954086 RepID=UPI0027347BFF|nr:hypothetical protein [Pseudomonas sp. FP2196]WLH33932.1 hypothetical protein PSH79_18560 [Pseudomonas sp. FP2196]
MAISLNSAFIQPSATELSKTAQPLTTTSLSEDLKKTAVNLNPAAVYHPSDESQTISPTMEAIDVWLGRSQAADFPQIAEQHKNAHESLKLAFEDFKSALSYTFPDLASKKFGFTVEADGNLKALNPDNELSASDMDQLNSLLNASGALKTAALSYRDTSIELVAADAGWGGSHLGKYNLTKENFANTIDMAALFLPKGNAPSTEAIDGFFSHQLWRKGELGTPASDAAIVAARDAAIDAKRIDEKV